MNPDDETRLNQINRRDWLRLSSGALLSLGLWPGCARWSGKRSSGNYSFVVINDAHFQSPRCPSWFERVSASIRAQPANPEFCLMVGDLAEHGTQSELGSMREELRSLGMPYYPVMGNHDYVSATDRSVWDALYPRSLNYGFEHRGWQFIGLDSTEGTHSTNTAIQPHTMAWVDASLSKMDPAKPTVIFTHFPLGAFLPMRPTNANDLLDRFRDYNLVAVFNGHFHSLTERQFGSTKLTTNKCCAISRSNHDGTTEKGYFLCTAGEGQIQRQFVEVTMA